ncbi:MAG: ribonuclease P protein component [Rhodobacteraceae bacterium]|nr:ribonuclease P protein component [Paracoccaceae bacterium]
MTSPEHPVADPTVGAASGAPAISVLTKRADFLKANGGRRAHMPGFTLQARKRREDETSATPIRVGFTCSKKVGNAVARNRAKRRLREIARLTLPAHGNPGWDYVLIGKRDVTATRVFADLRCDLENALAKVHIGQR